jgi:hypothetical protein
VKIVEAIGVEAAGNNGVVDVLRVFRFKQRGDLIYVL